MQTAERKASGQQPFLLWSERAHHCATLLPYAAHKAQPHLFNAAELTRQKIKLTCFLLCRETHLGKASKQYVFLVSGKATLMPEVRGEWRTTAAHSNRDAKSTVGTVPILWPYRMIFSGLMPYLGRHTKISAMIFTRRFFPNDGSVMGLMCSVHWGVFPNAD